MKMDNILLDSMTPLHKQKQLQSKITQWKDWLNYIINLLK